MAYPSSSSSSFYYVFPSMRSYMQHDLLDDYIEIAHYIMRKDGLRNNTCPCNVQNYCQKTLTLLREYYTKYDFMQSINKKFFDCILQQKDVDRVLMISSPKGLANMKRKIQEYMSYSDINDSGFDVIFSILIIDLPALHNHPTTSLANMLLKNRLQFGDSNQRLAFIKSLIGYLDHIVYDMTLHDHGRIRKLSGFTGLSKNLYKLYILSRLLQEVSSWFQEKKNIDILHDLLKDEKRAARLFNYRTHIHLSSDKDGFDDNDNSCVSHYAVFLFLLKQQYFLDKKNGLEPTLMDYDKLKTTKVLDDCYIPGWVDTCSQHICQNFDELTRYEEFPLTLTYTSTMNPPSPRDELLSNNDPLSILNMHQDNVLTHINVGMNSNQESLTFNDFNESMTVIQTQNVGEELELGDHMHKDMPRRPEKDMIHSGSFTSKAMLQEDDSSVSDSTSSKVEQSTTITTLPMTLNLDDLFSSGDDISIRHRTKQNLKQYIVTRNHHRSLPTQTSNDTQLLLERSKEVRGTTGEKLTLRKSNDNEMHKHKRKKIKRNVSIIWPPLVV